MGWAWALLSFEPGSAHCYLLRALIRNLGSMLRSGRFRLRSVRENSPYFALKMGSGDILEWLDALWQYERGRAGAGLHGEGFLNLFKLYRYLRPGEVSEIADFERVRACVRMCHSQFGCYPTLSGFSNGRKTGVGGMQETVSDRADLVFRVDGNSLDE
jgi:hypothetical protein